MLSLLRTRGSSAKVTTSLNEDQRQMTKERLVDDCTEWVTQVQVNCAFHQSESLKARAENQTFDTINDNVDRARLIRVWGE